MANSRRRPVVGYVRVSTEGQVVDGVSLEMQRQKIQAWTALHDGELVDIYADEGLSGKDANRPGLQAALERVKREQGILVIYSLSRMSRSSLDCLCIGGQLEKSGCELVSITEAIDTSSPGGRMVFTVMAALCQFEREQIGERTRHAMAHKKAQGFRIGSIPHGYRIEGGKVIPDADEQRIIQMVKRLRRQGYSLEKISGELAQRGTFNRHGRPFNHKSIASMLKAA